MPQDKQLALVCYASSFFAYTAVHLVILVLAETRPVDADNFTFISHYLFLPALSLFAALFLQLQNTWLKWLYPFVFSAFGFIMLFAYGAPLSTLAANTAFIELRIFPPFIGAIIGLIIFYILKKSNPKES